MAEPFWDRKFRGEYVSLSYEDLTAQRLREIKVAFGPEYGVPAQLAAWIRIGDGDALTAALWLHSQVHGFPKMTGKTAEEQMLGFDWNASEWDAPDPKRKPASKKADPPTKPDTSDETGSTETP